MRVITLHPSDFDKACNQLAASIHPFHPDLVVGILTGGGEVGKRVAACLEVERYFEVSLQRPSTEKKRRHAAILKYLPLWMADMLRRYEARRLARKAPLNREASLPQALVDALASTRETKVLIADDAVDSGATMSAVIDALKKVAPDADVRCCALVVTTSEPIVNPDYAIWCEGVLLRFPWSMDYKASRR